MPLIDPSSREPDNLLPVDDPEAWEPGRETGKTCIDFIDLSPGTCERKVS